MESICNGTFGNDYLQRKRNLDTKNRINPLRPIVNPNFRISKKAFDSLVGVAFLSTICCFVNLK